MPVPDPNASRAVLIGVGDYGHQDLEPLPAAAAGARRLAELLRDPSVWGLPASHVTVLGADVSGSRILGAVRDAALEATDTLLVHFAGHGLRDRDEKLYLALAEADADHPQIGTLPYRTLRDVVRQAGYRARHRVTVLDCCYSGLAGAMSGAGEATREDLAHALDETVHPAGHGADGGEAVDGDDHGDCVLTSAPATRRSFVPPGAPFPEFTGELISVLEHGIAGVGPELSLEDAWRAVRRRMARRGSSEPQQFAQNAVATRIRLRNRAAGPATAGVRLPAGSATAGVRLPAGSSAPGPRPFENGPLAVVDAEDGTVRAYCAGGRVLYSPATTLAELLEWTLTRAGLGAPRLHRHGGDADPLLALTPAAAERFGLPRGPGGGSRWSLPDGHEVLVRLRRAGWQPTRIGFGPWARLYRPARGNRRQCVQLCVLPWGALDPRHWGATAQLQPAEAARVLGTYAERVITPGGSPGATGLSLMTALRPPTRAVRDKRTGAWVSAPNPAALTEAVDCAPCEAPDGHPVLAGLHPPSHRRTPDQVLMEEAHSWQRPPTGAELRASHVVGIRVNLAPVGAASRLSLGLDAPVHVRRPGFDKTLPGSWLVDLSHITLDARLPSPFTPHGRPPTGPAWYTTPTLAYAVELGFAVHPLEAYVRTRSAPYLDPWYERLRDGYVATMADLGMVPGLTDKELLDAMARRHRSDPGAAAVLGAIEATAEGGLALLGGQSWQVPQRPTWRPDIRAAVTARGRVNMHRKMLTSARKAGLFPLAVFGDCVVYASDGPSPLNVLPRTPEDEPLLGGFRLGVSPGLVTYAGARTMRWSEAVRAEHGPDFNVAQDIATGGGEEP
ncbi:telomere-associated protein Tap [Streptomyces nojiriensis]|uniref:telomere-associated protein Tap n=1 Tax=Streptomyces nojiriensis TaxID=66374 RepID=UPI003664D45A